MNLKETSTLLLLALPTLAVGCEPDPCVGECAPWETCEAVYGSRWNEDGACYERDVFVGCVEMVAQPDVVFVSIDEEGDCWRLRAGENPQGWGMDTSQPYACPREGPAESCDE